MPSPDIVGPDFPPDRPDGHELNTRPASGPALPAVPPPEDGPGQLWSAAQGGGHFYNRYEICTRIQVRTGLKANPVTGPVGTPADVVRLHAPVGVKTITWVAERIGAQPVLPHPSTGDLNDVLTYYDIQPESPTLQPDGYTYAWRVRGIYIYDLKLPPGDGDPIPVPTTAVITTPAVSLGINTGQFDRTLLASQPVNGGGYDLYS